MEEIRKNNLLFLWTSDNKETAMSMVLMYTYNAKKMGWWDNVTLLVWGPSAKLLAQDKELQNYLKKMQDKGIELVACKACAEMHGVVPELENMGINVFYVGQWFTERLKSGWTILSV